MGIRDSVENLVAGLAAGRAHLEAQVDLSGQLATNLSTVASNAATAANKIASGPSSAITPGGTRGRLQQRSAASSVITPQDVQTLSPSDGQTLGLSDLSQLTDSPIIDLTATDGLPVVGVPGTIWTDPSDGRRYLLDSKGRPIGYKKKRAVGVLPPDAGLPGSAQGSSISASLQDGTSVPPSGPGAGGLGPPPPIPQHWVWVRDPTYPGGGYWGVANGPGLYGEQRPGTGNSPAGPGGSAPAAAPSSPSSSPSSSAGGLGPPPPVPMHYVWVPNASEPGGGHWGVANGLGLFGETPPGTSSSPPSGGASAGSAGLGTLTPPSGPNANLGAPPPIPQHYVWVPNPTEEGGGHWGIANGPGLYGELRPGETSSASPGSGNAPARLAPAYNFGPLHTIAGRGGPTTTTGHDTNVPTAGEATIADKIDKLAAVMSRGFDQGHFSARAMTS